MIEISTESTEDSANPQLLIDSNDNILVIWNDTTDYRLVEKSKIRSQLLWD